MDLAGRVSPLLASALLVFVRVHEAGIQVLQISGWPAPFGITLVADLLAAVLVVAVGVVGTAIAVVGFSGVDPRREAFGYHPLIQILLMGVAGAFLTGDLFNLYVWFEVMLVASFVLIALNGTRAQMEAAFKYVTINLIASSIFLTALGLLYGATGTLNMAGLARVWPTIGRQASKRRSQRCSCSRSASRRGCSRCSSGCPRRITPLRPRSAPRSPGS